MVGFFGGCGWAVRVGLFDGPTEPPLILNIPSLIYEKNLERARLVDDAVAGRVVAREFVGGAGQIVGRHVHRGGAPPCVFYVLCVRVDVYVWVYILAAAESRSLFSYTNKSGVPHSQFNSQIN